MGRDLGVPGPELQSAGGVWANLGALGSSSAADWAPILHSFKRSKCTTKCFMDYGVIGFCRCVSESLDHVQYGPVQGWWSFLVLPQAKTVVCSQELLDFLVASRGGPVSYGSYLCGIWCDALTWDYVAEEGHFLLTKRTLKWFQLEPCLSQPVKHVPQVVQMFQEGSSQYEDVI